MITIIPGCTAGFRQKIFHGILLVFLISVYPAYVFSQQGKKATTFRVLVLAELHEQHFPFVNAAKIWLDNLASENNFTIDYIENPGGISSRFLSKYNLLIQLNYPPYGWSNTAKRAFRKYIRKGHGGWIGIHHATLLGDFNGYRMWPWFSDFMGGIRFTGYIAGFASANVLVEDSIQPCMLGVPSVFSVSRDEWYTYNQSPRPNVHVLASVDESRYSPSSDIKMGDHPVVWTNTNYKARNIYIQMGHHPDLFQNPSYTRLLKNAIFWAAGQ